MDKKQTSPKLLQAEFPPAQEEQVPANPPLRKRPLDSDDDAEPRAKRARTTRPTSEPARLTRKNLARFDKMGKKKVPDPTDESKSTKTKTTSTTTSGFADKAYKNHILPRIDSKRPTSTNDTRRRHAAPRDTASPPESVYEGYADRVGMAGTEATMVFEVGGKLLKEYDDKGYRREFNRAFTNVPQDAGYNNSLSAPQPDFVEGLKKGQFRPFPVADHIPGAALYQDDPYSVTLPHIAGEWKGRGKDMEEAELQSAYDGAAMVYARRQALAYMGKSDPPGYAAITTFATDGTTLNMYEHYAAPSEEDPGILEYHQYKYASTNVKDSYQGHKDGRKGLRNAQDYARDQSYALKDQLKEHWRQQRYSLNPIAEGTLPPVPHDTEEDANENDYEVVEPQPVYQPTPPTDNHTPSTGQKRKTSSLHGSSHGSLHGSSHGSSGHVSKHKSYWKKDARSGRYYHKHSDGTVSWLDDDEEDERD